MNAHLASRTNLAAETVSQQKIVIPNEPHAKTWDNLG